MKTKRFSEKLSLNKVTIVNLSNGEMNDLNGGTLYPTEVPTGGPFLCCESISICICED